MGAETQTTAENTWRCYYMRRKLVVNGEVVAVIQETQQIVVVDDEQLNLGDYIAGTLDSNMDFDGVKNYEWIRDKKGISMLLDFTAKVEEK